jgi:hypothetical protein
MAIADRDGRGVVQVVDVKVTGLTPFHDVGAYR